MSITITCCGMARRARRPVSSGKVELECGSTTATLERRSHVDFSPIDYRAGRWRLEAWAWGRHVGHVLFPVAERTDGLGEAVEPEVRQDDAVAASVDEVPAVAAIAIVLDRRLVGGAPA
jgi:hypothetical protein